MKIIRLTPSLDLPVPRRPVSGVCRILCSTVWDLSRNLSDLTVAWSQYDLLLCYETLVSERHHLSELPVPGFCRPLLLCQDRMPRARGMAAYVRDENGSFRQQKFECTCGEVLLFMVCGATLNVYVFRLYLSPHLNDWIYGCSSCP